MTSIETISPEELAHLKEQAAEAERLRSELELMKSAYSEIETKYEKCKETLREQKTEKFSVQEKLDLASVIIDNSPVVLFRREAGEEARLVYVSENVKKFGYTVDEFLNGTITYREIVHPDDMQEMVEGVRKNNFEGSDEYTQVYRIITKSGDIRWIEDQTSVIRDENGKRVFHQGILYDTTETTLARDALQVSLNRIESEKRKADALNTKLLTSIRYAQMIQHSILPDSNLVKNCLPESFFIWNPRDIVGGDIFYIDAVDDGLIVCLMDCTGHGVPGAFMSMIASSLIRRIIREEDKQAPEDILAHLNAAVKTTLRQDTQEALSDDGLDAAVCRIRYSKRVLEFAGAGMPLILKDDRNVRLIKGDRQSIGYKRSRIDYEYTRKWFSIENGMRFYMFSDGYTDQLGGQKCVMFGKKRLLQLLSDIGKQPFDLQKKELLRAFDDYRGENEVQDDVTFIGFGMDGICS